MQYRQLGHTGLRVSNLCLGAMTFGLANDKSFMHGVSSDQATSFAIMDRALEAGINFIDTADVYGQDGLSERVIGMWFRERNNREKVVLATKFRFTMNRGPNGKGASRHRIMHAVEASLRRLQTDHIDLYQVHMQDIDTPEEETLRALDDLVRQGKVLYIGASNYAAYRLMESLWISDRRNLERFAAFQVQYSLLVRSIEREHVPVCTKYGLGILPWSPLASGFLTGKYRPENKPEEGSRLAKWRDTFRRLDTPQNWKILETVEEVAKELETTPARVSLAWLLRRPAVSSVIFGARSLEQLEDNLAAAELALPNAAYDKLCEVSAVDVGYPYTFMGGEQGRW